MNLIEKIICHNAIGLRNKIVKAGDFVVTKVNRTLASEITQVGIEDTLNNLKVNKLWRNDRFFLAVDHSVDPNNYHEKEVQNRIGTCNKFAKKFNLTEYFGPNQSILHTEFYRQKAMPGSIVIGADSHSCSHGCVGSLAIGLGASDVAMPLITGKTWLQVPEVIKINFHGKLPFGMVGKDVILHILSKYGRNTIGLQKVIEFGGNTYNLDIDSRFAIANMATEFGAIAGVFPPDHLTKDFIANRKYKTDEEPFYFKADDNAEYHGVYDIDLSEIKPMIAKYPNPDDCYELTDMNLYKPIYDNNKMICETIKKLDGIFIGACTTTENEIILAGLLLESMMDKYFFKPKNRDDKPYHRILTPGSTIMYEYLEKIGILDIYRKAGFRVDAPGCSMCLGLSHQKAKNGEIWLSSQNRNFRNRMGQGGIGNLSSACTAAASSFKMEISWGTNPKDFLRSIDKKRYYDLIANKPIEEIKYDEPNPELINENNKKRFDERIIQNSMLTEINGKVQIFGDNVDTDQIMPAQYIVLRGDKLLTKSFKFVRPNFIKNIEKSQNIIVAGEGFGCGSSREEAVTALKLAGIQAIIAKSFSFIYYRNLLTHSLRGIIIKDQKFYDNIKENSEIKIRVKEGKVILDNVEYPYKSSMIEEKIYDNNGVIGLYEKYKDDAFDVLTQ